MITNKPSAGEPIAQDPDSGRSFIATPVFWTFLDELAQSASLDDVEDLTATIAANASSIASNATNISGVSQNVNELQTAVARLNSLVSQVDGFLISRLNKIRDRVERQESIVSSSASPARENRLQREVNRAVSLTTAWR